MEILIKIVVAVLNFVCYVATLAYPCDATVFTLLPAIITSSMWIVESARKVGLYAWNIILMIISAVAGGTCLFLGLTSTLGVSLQQANDYYFQFRSTVAVIGNIAFPYSIFAVSAIILFLGLTIPELILFGKGNRREKAAVESFDRIIDKAIGKSH